MKAKSKIEGLYLWEVEVAYRNYLGSTVHRSLLITTPIESVKVAIKKAESVLRRNRDEWPRGRVSGVERKGTLDA